MQNQILKKVNIVIAILFIGIISWIGFSDTATAEQAEETDTTITEVQNTTYPSLAGLNFSSGTTEQMVNITNPENNSDLMKIIIYNSDGSVLTESKYIRPGKTLTKLTLNSPLNAGDYSVKVKIEMVLNDLTKTEQSSSEINTTIHVI